jgi:ribonuclease-3
VQNVLTKSASSARKTKPRASQLKLAGIATVQPDAPVDEDSKKPSKPGSKSESVQDVEQGAKPEIKPVPKPPSKADNGPDLKNNSKTSPKSGANASSEGSILPLANETKTA